MSRGFADLRQMWPMPSAPRPITIIGAGGVVRSAHLPAYEKWRLPVAGIYDRDHDRARALAAEFDVPVVHSSLAEAFVADGGNVFDIALPPHALVDVLPQLPRGATVLIQKPLGTNLAEARELARILTEREATAAVNFQLRFTPAMVAVSDALAKGLLGTPLEVEVRLACHSPWQDWPFLRDLDHVEIPAHSIHYLDWIRAELGLPTAVYAKCVRHPDHPDLKDARSSIVLDYGDSIRCCLNLNQTYKWGRRHEAATFRLEGTKGAAVIGLGYLLHYSGGAPESLSLVHEGGDWSDIDLEGARMPDAFAAVMANLQRYAAGEDTVLETDISSSLGTMALVDACVRSHDASAVIHLAPD